MALLDSTVGLIYSIKADDADARKSVSDLRSHIDKETDGMKESSDNAFLSLGKSIGLTDSQITSLSKSLPVVGAVAAGIAGIATVAVGTAAALFSLAKQTADTGTEISRFSTLTGFSVETVGALKIAAEAAGTSIDEIEEVFESFVELMIEAGQGADDAKDKLKTLGLDPQTAYKDLEGSFLKVLDRIREMPTQAGKAKVAMDGMGESGLNMIKVAEGMDGGTAKYIARLKEMGVVMDKDAIARSKEFNRTLAQLELQIKGLIYTFAGELQPVFSAAMKDLGLWFAQNRQSIGEWGTYAVNIFRSVITAIKEFVEFAKNNQGWIRFGLAVSTYGVSEGVRGSLNAMETIGQNQNSPAAMPNQISAPPAPSGSNNNFLADLAKQREEAEKHRKEREVFNKAELAAQVQLQRRHLNETWENYDVIFKSISERLKKTGAKETFKRNFDELKNHYSQVMQEIVPIYNDLVKKQTLAEVRGRNQIEVVYQEHQKTLKGFSDNFEKSKSEADKLLSESAKTESDKRVKTTQAEANRKIELDRASTATRLAELNLDFKNKLISEKAFLTASSALKIKVLESEKESLELIEQTDENRVELKQKIKLLDEQIAQQRIANSEAVVDAINKETAAEIEAEKERRQKLIDNPETEGAEDDSFDNRNSGLFGGMIQGMGLSIEDMMQKVEPLKGIGDIIGGQFDTIANAVGNAVSAFVLFGSAGGSFRKFAAEMMASIAQMAIVQAVWELAQGFAMLALSWFTGNPKYGAAAGAHFSAAALYGAVGGVAAIAGRAVAGDAFKQQTATGGGNPSTGGNSGGGGGGNGGGAYSGMAGTQIIENGANAAQDRGEMVFTFKGAESDWFSQIFDVEFRKNGKIRNILREEFA